MQRNIVETVLGAVVLLVAGGFFFFAYNKADVATVDGYELKARFTRVDGLEAGSDVSIGGVKVGTVLDFVLDPETYLAIVHLSIKPEVKLPTDTAAVISSKGLLDGKYMALQPGGEEEYLENGDYIEYTQSTPGLEQLLGQVIFSLTNSKDSGGNKNDTPPADITPPPGAAAFPEMP